MDQERRATPRQYPGYTPAIPRPGAAQIFRKMAKIVCKNLRRVGTPNAYLPIVMNLTFFAPELYPRCTICRNRVFLCSFFIWNCVGPGPLSLGWEPAYFQYWIRNIELFRKKHARCRFSDTDKNDDVSIHCCIRIAKTRGPGGKRTI